MVQLTKNTIVLILVKLVFLNMYFSQFLHLSPVSFDDISINPSVLSTSRLEQNLSVQQFNSFSSGSIINHSKLQFSKKLFRPFIGAGISAQQTTFNGNSISNVGLGISYSTVLFNRVRFHAGMTGSAIYINSNSSVVDFYEQNLIAVGITQSKWLGNLNYSFALSIMNNRFHLSYSKVNGHQIQNREGISYQFNTSHILQVGNLLAFGGAKNQNYLSLMAVYTPLSITSETLTAYFTKVRLNFRLSRKSNLLYGGTFGWHSNNSIQLMPTVGLGYKNHSFGLQFNYFSKTNTHQISNLIGAFFFITL